jgi:hypothetical protein
MASKKPEFTAEQIARIEATKKQLGVKFLPIQAQVRAADPKSGLQILGASRRHKIALDAKRAKLR